MRTLLTTLTAVVILCGMALTVRAEDDDRAKSPGDEKRIDAKAQWIACAKLRIKMHRTLADLIEARIAPEPNKAKIEVLEKELQQVRKELHEQRPSRRGGPGCPWGEPGMGPNRGYGRPGPGMGPGPKGDRGRGQNMGPGRGYGRPGQGMGPGPRNDRGRGRNIGPGRGYGRPGQGMGSGPRDDRGRGRNVGPGWEDGPRRGFGPGPSGPNEDED